MSHRWMSRPEDAGGRFFGAFAALLLLFGCATNSEQSARKELADASRQERKFSTSESGDTAARPSVASSPPASSGDSALHASEASADLGGPKTGEAASDETSPLAEYVALALSDSPELEASFARWQASVSRISRSRRLPEPTVSFGLFVRAVETRVGPQRARIGLSQTFPWPTRLSAGADAASAGARAEQAKFDAQVLAVRQKVALAYYRLWLVRTLRRIHEQHSEVVRSLSESVAARLSIGSATLAELQQVDLSVSRLQDTIKGLDEAEVAAIMKLRSNVGHWELSAPGRLEDPPPCRLPTEAVATLRDAAKSHPLLTAYEHRARSEEHLARSKEAEGLPSFQIGADWIITDEATTAGVVDSGKDAVIVGGAVSVPLWRGVYGGEADAARADARAIRFERKAAEDRALATLERALSSVRDAARRVTLHTQTLVPQADAAYASVLGAYAVGQGSVAQTLLSQKDLLELRQQLAEARADHAIAWAELELVVGREVK